MTICHEYDKNYAKYPRYVNQNVICRICTLHFADVLYNIVEPKSSEFVNPYQNSDENVALNAK